MQLDEILLNTYLDGELSRSERERVEQQLAALPEAQALLAQLKEETGQLDQVLDLLGPPSGALSPAWLVLKRLRPHLTSTLKASSNGKDTITPKMGTGSATWESPTLFTEIKSNLKHLRREGTDIMRNKVPIVAGLGLVTVIAIVIAFWLSIDPARLFQPVARTPVPFASAEAPGQASGGPSELSLVQETGISTTQVIVALQPIAQGQEFSPDSIGRRMWPTHNLPPGYLSDEVETIGRVAKTDIVQGQVVAQEMLAEAAPKAMTTTSIVFDDAVDLAGYKLFTNTVSAGDALRLKLYWRRRPAANNNYASFLQLVDSAGTTLAQKQTPLPLPQANLEPGLSGQVVEIPYTLPLAENFPTGEFDLLVGLTTVAQNLQLPVNPDTHRAKNIAFLTRITVTAPLSLPPATSASLATAGFAPGIQVDPNGNTAANVEHLKKLEMNWVKFQMPWQAVEPQPGQYEWTKWDELIGAYADNGINVLLTIAAAPDWARPVDDDKKVEGLPQDSSLYADFVARVAARYAGQVAAIELWEEQNLFYKVGGQGRVNPTEYVELLKAAYTAIKAANPEMTVVSGGLTPTGAPPPFAMDDMAYLRQMYAHGAQDYFDALGTHLPGFANPPDANYQGGDYDPSRGFDDHRSFFFRSTLEAYRQVMVENGDEAKPIWPTEFGWPVWQAGGDERFIFAKENSLAEQAEYTVKAFEMGRQWPWVGPMFLSNLDYNVTASDRELALFGILETPTYEALAAMPKTR